MRRVLKIIAATALIVGVATAGISLWGTIAVYNRSLYEYQGVRLGDPMEEILYAMGSPQVVLTEPDPIRDADIATAPAGALRMFYTDPNIPDTINRLPKNTTVENYTHWSYGDDYRYTRVEFDPNSKRVVEVGCVVPAGSGDFSSRCGPLFGVYGDDEARFINEFGHPSSSNIDSASGVKTLGWDAMGLRIKLIKRKAYYARKLERQGDGLANYLLSQYF